MTASAPLEYRGRLTYLGIVWTQLPSEACIEWPGVRDKDGYGRAKLRGKDLRAHRFVYEQIAGPIPRGLQLDHLCRNHGCVNPEHLEPVTNGENLLRGDTLNARNAAKTHCDRGHPFDEENTRRQARGRECKECRRITGRAGYARRRAALLGFIAVVLLATATPAPAVATEPGDMTAIVAVHGGGWASGTPAKMNAVCADAIYDCFQPSYTLSGVAPFNIQVVELRDYVLNLRAEGYTRIIGIGASAGGNLVGWLADHDYLDAAVTLSAPTQLLVLADWTRPGCPSGCVAQFAPSQQKKTNASPALGAIEIPLLIIHGDAETLIPPMQSNRLAWVSTNDTQLWVPGNVHAMAYWSQVTDDVALWIGALA